MGYFVYIIHSSKYDLYYKGYSTNPYHRLFEHNSGLSRYTKAKRPWVLVYLEELPDKKTALIREKQIKKYNHTYIKILIGQPQNLLR
ncbi:MAG: GIY-YIG nuclease family protein [Bacteroidetes bacterium]|nr:GIY-YIG nuclease family protein [Bacteroidota bacterium]